VRRLDHLPERLRASSRTLRWGEPDNGLRLGIEVRQETDNGLVIEDCTFVVYFEPAAPRISGDQGDDKGDEPLTYLLVSRNGGSVTTRAMEVTLTMPNGQKYTMPQKDEGDWVWAGTLITICSC
jgi:hypothetical protein